MNFTVYLFNTLTNFSNFKNNNFLIDNNSLGILSKKSLLNTKKLYSLTNKNYFITQVSRSRNLNSITSKAQSGRATGSGEEPTDVPGSGAETGETTASGGRTNRGRRSAAQTGGTTASNTQTGGTPVSGVHDDQLNALNVQENQSDSFLSRLSLLTPEEKVAIENMLKKQNSFDNTTQNISKLNSEEVFDKFFNQEEKLFKEVKIFERGDVIELVFNLKHTGVRTINSTNNPFSNAIILENQDPNNFLESFNFLEKKVNMFFMVFRGISGYDKFEVAQQFGLKLWNNYFKNFTSDQICLESISLKTVYPYNKVSEPVNVGITDFGALINRSEEISRRPFVFTLSSNFITGNKDAYTIRWFFMDSSYQNPHISTNDSVAQAPIKNLCSFLENQIEIGKNANLNNNETLLFKLAVATARKDSPFAYAPIKYVWPTGFVGNVQKSTILIPLLTNNSSSNNGRSSQEPINPLLSGQTSSSSSINELTENNTNVQADSDRRRTEEGGA